MEKKQVGTNGLFVSEPGHNGNKIVVSRLQHYERIERKSAQLSIKYVLSGAENYTLQKNTFTVKDGYYLLVNKGQQLETVLNGTQTTTGLCLFFDEDFLQDVYRNEIRSEEYLLDNPWTETKHEMHFDLYEDTFHYTENSLGQLVHSMAGSITPDERPVSADPQLYYRFAREILRSQRLIYRQMDQLKTQRQSTRKELYRRIRMARMIIEECPVTALDIPSLARQASLSEFHFFRTFKQVLGVSPYQYILKKRLAYALMLLKEQCHTISEVAFLTGFADIHSFSKAFKKQFRVPPSQVMKSSFNKG